MTTADRLRAHEWDRGLGPLTRAEKRTLKKQWARATPLPTAQEGTMQEHQDNINTAAETPAREPAIIEPTVGRVVWFWPRGQNALTQPLAATIASVQGTRTITIGFLSAEGYPNAQAGVLLRQPEDPLLDPYTPHASWMPYQVGQAKR